MPEGPEVTVMAKNLSKVFKNALLKDVIINHTKFKSKLVNETAFYENLSSKIKEISNIGKFVYIKLANGWSLGFTPGMTGHFYAEGHKYNEKYNYIEIVTSNGSFYFNDPRLFGHFYIYQKDELNNKLKTLGPDLLKDLEKMSQSEFNERLSKYNKSIKNLAEVLLDQKFIAGIGNYLRADSLYEAKISPLRKVSSLNVNDKKRLKHSLEKVSKESYDAQKGNSLHTYKFKIYGDPNAKQTKDRMKRTIWWDPKIQK